MDESMNQFNAFADGRLPVITKVIGGVANPHEYDHQIFEGDNRDNWGERIDEDDEFAHELHELWQALLPTASAEEIKEIILERMKGTIGPEARNPKRNKLYHASTDLGYLKNLKKIDEERGTKKADAYREKHGIDHL